MACLIDRQGPIPRCSNAIAQLNYSGAPRSVGVGTFGPPRLSVDHDFASDTRWRRSRFLQQRDVGIRIQQSSPSVGAARDVPGNQVQVRVRF
jgi:hypothetical protein